MSITFTTSIGLPKDAPKNADIPWIEEKDGIDMTWSTSAMTAQDIMIALGADEDDKVSGNTWPIDDFQTRLKAFIDSPLNDGDYPFKQASFLLEIVERGAAAGAVFVLAA